MLYDASYSSPTILNFNSKDRIAGTNSNFVSEPVDVGLNKYDTVCLVQASIPKSWYNMPTNYNQFTLTEYDNSGFPEPPITITIPIGNYNKINLASKLSSLLTSASASGPFGATYTVSNPLANEPDTFHFTFTITGGSGLGLAELTFDETSPFRQLGFESNSTNTFISTLGGLVLESTNAINLAFILRAFIKTNMIQNATDSILEEVLSVGSFPTSSLVYFQQYDFNMNSREFNSSSVNSWQFVLVDGFDQEIDLNGISWAFSVVLYKRNNTHELHKQELQIVNEERIFKIEQNQRTLKETLIGEDEEKVKDKLITINGIQLSDTKANPLEPIFPVFPFTQGLAYLNEPEIKYPTK